MLRILGNTIFIVLLLLIFIVLLTLKLPSLFNAITASLIAAFLIYKWKRIPTEFGLIFIGSVLGAWIVVFEYVPPGQVDIKMKVNNVQFQDLIGAYYMGDGLSTNLYMDITPSGRFYLIWKGCLGIYKREKGWIDAKNGAIILHSNLNFWKVTKSFQGNIEELIPVRWGERIYLIRKKDMIEFCSDINLGREPRKEALGNYYLRKKDWEKAPDSHPQLPVQWRKYIFDKPVRGNIVELISNRKGVINVGHKNGLLPGMMLYSEDFENVMSSLVIIVSVEETHSIIECLWGNSQLAVGQVISTGRESNGVKEETKGSSPDS